MPSSILVVEDTELLRKIYADKLKQDGYEVLTAVGRRRGAGRAAIKRQSI